jgi:hypothetical protein
MDNTSTFAGPTSGTVRPFALFAEQTGGPSPVEGATVDEVVPEGARGAALGDARWPERAGGEVLPSLDLLGASLTLQRNLVVARIPLGDGSQDRMTDDLASYNSQVTTASPAERLLYVMRFSTPDDVYHLSMEFDPGRGARFFGGRLDANDQITNIGSTTVVAARYRADPSFNVTGDVVNHTLELRISAAALGVSDGSRLYGASAFATAGPTEADESLVEMMRTVDATPPFDAQLVERAVPSPVPSSVPSPTPSPPAPRALRVFAFPADASREVGDYHEITAVVTDEDGRPVSGAALEWQSAGAGEIASHDQVSNEEGVASAFVRALEPGEQVVTVATSGCAEEGCSTTARVTWNAPGCDVTGTAGADTLAGTAADDVICGRGGADTVTGGPGNDVLIGSSGSDVLGGELGHDRLRAGRGRDRGYGGRGRDALVGRAGRDRLGGGRGSDMLGGGGANDSLGGGRGADRAFGREGTDVIAGGRGRDVLSGGPGRDVLRGGRGRDRCHEGGPRRPEDC